MYSELFKIKDLLLFSEAAETTGFKPRTLTDAGWPIRASDITVNQIFVFFIIIKGFCLMLLFNLIYRMLKWLLLKARGLN